MSSEASDEEPPDEEHPIDMAKYPSVTKEVRVSLERCDATEAGAEERQNTTTTGADHMTQMMMLTS